jgi:hypothetical protein
MLSFFRLLVHLSHVTWLVIVVTNCKVRAGCRVEFTRLKALSDHFSLVLVVINATGSELATP